MCVKNLQQGSFPFLNSRFNQPVNTPVSHTIVYKKFLRNMINNLSSLLNLLFQIPYIELILIIWAGN